MPLKGFKGFNRQKTSPSAPEESSEAPLVSSFRVLERPHEPSKSFDGGHHLLRANADARPASAGWQTEVDRRIIANRGSNGTQNSASTGGGPYHSSSSAHYSSTSTLPSATSHDAIQEDSYGHPMSKTPLPHTQTAPPGFSFRTAFGGRKSVPQPMSTDIILPQQHASYSDIPDVRPAPRQRALTDSSEHTTTPGRLLGPDFSFRDEDTKDDFSNLFSNIGEETQRPAPAVVESPASMGPPDGMFFGAKRTQYARPNPPQVSISQPASPAPPASAINQGSREALLGSSALKQEATGLRRKPTPPGGPPVDVLVPSLSNTGPYSNGNLQSPRPAVGLRERTLIPSARTPSPNGGQPSPPQRPASEPLGSFADEDLQLAMQYIDQSEPTPPLPPAKDTPRLPSSPSSRHSPEPLIASQPSLEPTAATNGARDAVKRDSGPYELSGADYAETSSILMTPKLTHSGTNASDEYFTDDASMQEIALYADRLESEAPAPAPKPKPVNTGKVMTPAQFELYRKEQERRKLVEDSDSDSEEEETDKEDEDAEEERNRELVRQRRKQEADLAVYRQKMMKITGESGQRPVSQQPSQPMGQIPSINLQDPGTGSGSGANSEEEDEDVPLGILAAHGFPSRNRPPSHLDGGRASVQYSSETYPAPSNAGLGTTSVGASGQPVPAFAKNLPKDPFYGASLVTPADRQSLAFGTGASSVYAASQAGGTGPPNPGGLVGVIAKEERARAMRRGSPNTGFDTSNAASGLTSPSGAVPGLPPPMSPEQHAQMQVTQQMTQMMQMQMQWMQQMMAMQQNMGGAAPPMPPKMASMMAANPYGAGNGLPANGRPASAYPGVSPYSQGPRASSRVSIQPRNTAYGAARSTTSLGAPPAGYAPSLAPSERSTVGQPSRYRPVSTMPEPTVPPQFPRTQRTGSQGSVGLVGDPSQYSSGPAGGRQSPGNFPKLGSSPGNGPSMTRTPPPAVGRTSRLPPPRTARPRGTDEDEDDDAAGWAAMHAARVAKRGTWQAAAAQREQHAARGRRGAAAVSGQDGDAGLEELEGVAYLRNAAVVDNM